jgi:hypothetical protein
MDHNLLTVLIDYFYRYIDLSYLAYVFDNVEEDSRLCHFHVGTLHNSIPNLNFFLRVSSLEYII